VLLSSLVGSLHCAGMCGPLVAAYAGLPGPDASWRRRAAAHAAYSAGRLAAYVALGACAGAIGGAIDLAAHRAGVARAAEIVSGVLVTLWGVHALLAASGARVPRMIEGPRWARRSLGRAMRAVAAAPPIARAGAIGLATSLVPCGWLYVFVATAGGTGRVLAGALVMAAFWAGTVPVMVALGESVRALSGPLRRRLPVLSAAAIVVLGLLTVCHRAQLAPFAQAPACHANR
jgi:sulfite exporter TauE/SafE